MAGRVLVVDDDAGIRDFLQSLLAAHGYLVITARDSREALNATREERPDLLLADVMIPEMDGVTLCGLLRDAPATKQLPVVLMTASGGIEDFWRASGADAVVRKPFNNVELLSWVRCLVRSKRTEEDVERAETTLVSVATVIEARSLRRKDHVQRVAGYSAQLAAAVGLGEDATEIIRKAALLHDVGEIGVPETLLQKPGRLTPGEFEQVKRHTILGADLCRSLRHGDEISAIVRGHHERWDGKGYPDGLAGEEIPLGDRIVAVADALDVLMTDRPYRAALSPAEAVETLWFGAAEQWDSRLVELAEPLAAESTSQKRSKIMGQALESLKRVGSGR